MNRNSERPFLLLLTVCRYDLLPIYKLASAINYMCCYLSVKKKECKWRKPNYKI